MALLACVSGIPRGADAPQASVPFLVAPSRASGALRGRNAVPVRILVLPMPSTTRLRAAITAEPAVVPLRGRQVLIRNRGAPLTAFPIH